MFERYTEKARRVIFFARYEAGKFGSPTIESEHLLLGLVREDKALSFRLLPPDAAESIRKEIEAHTTFRAEISTSVDMPLSSECKRVLSFAAEEAERLAHKHIGTEHLLLGLLREEKCFAAALLHERGLRIDAVRLDLARSPSVRRHGTEEETAPVIAAPGHDRHSSGAHLEFVYNGTRVGLVALGHVSIVPLVGEEVVLPEARPPLRTFRVTAVQHHYETVGTDPALRQLQRIVVQVEPLEPGGRP